MNPGHRKANTQFRPRTPRIQDIRRTAAKLCNCRSQLLNRIALKDFVTQDNMFEVNRQEAMIESQKAQCVPAVLGPQEVIQLVTQRAREALHDQCETARRALLRQQGRLIAATYQCVAAARENLVNILARNEEAHRYNEQMQVPELEHEVFA